jgi:nucleotide-binding universal stress UspA family protein
VVVVGHRGLGGFTGLLVGSVGVQVAAHAAGPVVVVRPHSAAAGASAGRVVVGIDGSPLSRAALGFGFEAAARRGVGLTAVHAWTEPVSTGPGDMLPLVYDADDVDAEETRLLAEALAGWAEKYPDVPVDRKVVRGRAAEALVAESAGAALLVVGSPGRGGFTGLLLGSVSQAALHHADCPVAIVRPPAS